MLKKKNQIILKYLTSERINKKIKKNKLLHQLKKFPKVSQD